MFILSTEEMGELSKEIEKLGGVFEREISRSWVFKELNFTRLTTPLGNSIQVCKNVFTL